MSGFTLSPRAQADIEEIWDFTAGRFGLDQAEAYVRGIERAISTVAADPRRGRACDDVRAGYHKFLVGSHVLFFRLTGDGIDVVRILHGRMDFGAHLN